MAKRDVADDVMAAGQAAIDQANQIKASQVLAGALSGIEYPRWVHHGDGRELLVSSPEEGAAAVQDGFELMPFKDGTGNVIREYVKASDRKPRTAPAVDGAAV